MSVQDWIAVISLALVVMTTLVGMLFWLFSVQSTANTAKRDLEALHVEREKDKTTFSARLEKAETAAAGVGNLATAIEHLAEKFQTALLHMGERTADHHRYVSEQLADIKHDQKNLHAKVEAVPVAATRSRPRAAKAG